MNNQQRIQLDFVIKELSKLRYVECIYLFGSQINKRAREDSDIDIAVITKKINKNQELNIRGYCNDTIDISIFNKIPLIIQHRVLKEGKLMFCRDNKYLNEIKVNTIKNYLDYSSFINRFYRRALQNV